MRSQISDLAKMIKERRELRGLSQSQLAAHAGISPSIVSRAEKSDGGSVPSEGNMRAIARALGAESMLMYKWAICCRKLEFSTNRPWPLTERVAVDENFAGSTGELIPQLPNQELLVATTHSLLTIPLALNDAVDARIATTIEPASGEGVVPLTTKKLESLLKAREVHCIWTLKHDAHERFVDLAMLRVEFSSSAIDIVPGTFASRSGGPRSETEIERWEALREATVADRGNFGFAGEEFEEILGLYIRPNAQLPGLQGAEGATGGPAFCAMEPISSWFRSKHWRGHSCLSDGARVSLEYHLLVRSKVEFESLKPIVEVYLKGLAQVVESRTDDSKESIAYLARIYQMEPTWLRGFLQRAQAKWSLTVSSLWLSEGPLGKETP